MPVFQQVNADVSPVVLANVFRLAEGEIPALLKAWEDDANWMKQQPGYISTQLHRGIAGSTVFMNYAVSVLPSDQCLPLSSVAEEREAPGPEK